MGIYKWHTIPCYGDITHISDCCRLVIHGCHSYLIVIGRTTWEHTAHSRISYLKIFKEGVNPFPEGYLKNVCTFLSHCRVRKWEKAFQRSSINFGV
jgi:hypothetical protein